MIANAVYNSDSDYVYGGMIGTTEQGANRGTATAFGGDFRVDHVVNSESLKLHSWASYSYVDGEVKDLATTYDLQLTAAHKIKAGLTLRLKDRFFVTPTVNWIGETNSFYRASNFDGSGGAKQEKIDAYTLVNLTAGIDNLIGGFSGTLRIRNLLNTKFYNAGGQSTAEFFASPQDPLSVVIGVEYHYE